MVEGNDPDRLRHDVGRDIHESQLPLPGGQLDIPDLLDKTQVVVVNGYAYGLLVYNPAFKKGTTIQGAG